MTTLPLVSSCAFEMVGRKNCDDVVVVAMMANLDRAVRLLSSHFGVRWSSSSCCSSRFNCIDR